MMIMMMMMKAISSLIVPAPKWNKESISPDGESTAPPSDR